MIRWRRGPFGRPARRAGSGVARGATTLIAAIALTGCDMPLALQPKGPAADYITGLWWWLFGTAAVVCLVVFVLLFVALGRARRPDALSASDGFATRFVYVGGAIVPAVVLTGFTYVTLAGLSTFDRGPEVEHVVTVTGHQFWWEIEYEGETFTTANQLHMPVGEPVRVELESADVIHSFWVPQLHGKIEMVPGHVNVLHLEADEPGTYLGKCAEFCGTQHARMEFLVVAEEREAYDAWLEGQRQEAAEPATASARAGREVFVDAQCALCHTIRGVSNAAAEAGPDLTHLASREMLAANTLPNTRGHLGGWIADPQGVKPGVLMPSVQLDSDEFLALLDFLSGLE